MIKLTRDDVAGIHKCRERGFTLMAIASKFGISHMQVSRILSGENWAERSLCASGSERAVLKFFSAVPPVNHEKLNITRQVLKIRAELMEAESAFEECNVEHGLVEVWDIITACSTLLKRAKENGNDIVAAHAEMIDKNDKRRYYENAKH